MELQRRGSALHPKAGWRARVAQACSQGHKHALQGILEHEAANVLKLTKARPNAIGYEQIDQAVAVLRRSPDMAFGMFVYGAGHMIYAAGMAPSAFEGMQDAGKRVERLLVSRLSLKKEGQ